MQPKIFSLNKVAYLKVKGYEPKRIGKDEETGKIYYEFPESEEIRENLRKYKENKELQEFLRIFKEIKKEIKSM
ncbi:hypothetical protein H0A61_02154 [Koleobacter methoxysyntrophicus]|uniref:DUF5659 domain-containing protein n=1 Tax=Koleobacter methoxysyntrophicus TaxID=2751313 RepID=A0A8A0RND0_9FIRM|nr:DUF5659 domain-containing protein [Koleobacter methoxysyntrophicus]QSQ09773.1 hypothetical protein H0A61_02154 [Koleobacter methoxysyntrophicus]